KIKKQGASCLRGKTRAQHPVWVCRHWRPDLMVLATQSHMDFLDALRGSTTERILQGALSRSRSSGWNVTSKCGFLDGSCQKDSNNASQQGEKDAGDHSNGEESRAQN